MREIKFRAWLKEEKRLVPWEKLWVEMENGYCGVAEFDDQASEHGEYSETTSDFFLMQYTGLKDRNGKEIYEGDILKGHYWVNGESNRIIGYVEFGYGSFVLYGVRKYKGLIKMPDSSFEIIGNIYEHPYLLEEEPA